MVRRTLGRRGRCLPGVDGRVRRRVAGTTNPTGRGPTRRGLSTHRHQAQAAGSYAAARRRHAQHTESDGQPHRHPTYATDQTAVGVAPGRRPPRRERGRPRATSIDTQAGECCWRPVAQPRVRRPRRHARPAPARTDAATAQQRHRDGRPSERQARQGGPRQAARNPTYGAWAENSGRPRRRPPTRAASTSARAGAVRRSATACPPWAHHRPVDRRRGWGDLPRHRGSDPDSVRRRRAPSVWVMWSPAPRVSAAVAFAVLAGTLSSCAEPLSGPAPRADPGESGLGGPGHRDPDQALRGRGRAGPPRGDRGQAHPRRSPAWPARGGTVRRPRPSPTATTTWD